MSIIKLRYIEDNSIHEWELESVINRINEDNATDEFNYDKWDWVEGFVETLEGEFYSLLDIDGTPLNDLSEWNHIARYSLSTFQ